MRHKTAISYDNVKIGNNVTIKEFSSVGKNVTLEDGVIVGEYVRIGEGCIIGENVVLKCRVTIAPYVTIGRDSFIGPHTVLLHGLPGEPQGPPKIEKNVYVAAGCVIAAGVALYEGVVLAAGSVALRDCNLPGLWAGSPAKFMREFTEEERWKIK